MTRTLILPGYQGSGPEHWQTRWEKAHGFTRVEEPDWEHPDRELWVASLEAAVSRQDPGAGIVLVAHSLACLQVAHWVADAARRPEGARAQREKIRAALLVAPPDPRGPGFPAAARGFGTVPRQPFPFPSLVVGSTDDPYASPGFAEGCARAWGAGFVSVGPRGHINAASGLGAWDEGWSLLQGLLR
jgi:predicted alpha/beta hydrolase family esterase